MAGNRIKGITVEIGGDTTKLQTALKGVNSEIKNTQAQLKDVEKMLKLDPGNTELLTQKHRLLGDAVKETKEKLETLKTAADQANDALAKGEITKEQYDALQREIVETENDLKRLTEAANQSGTAIQEIAAKGEKLKVIGDNVAGVGQKMMPATLAIVGLGTAAVKTASDFDSAMSKVAAVSGATGDDLIALREKAREMGAKTKFSASEAAEAMNYMAMAGWKTSDMLSGIEGVMSLAAASGEDLATTSDIVTDALTAFGLTAKDSGHFADVLAAASSNANTNVSMMGETFKYAAPIAGSLGYSIEDTAEAIGLMANAGIKSTQAGTSLRTIMTNLSGEVKICGASIGEVTVATSNADGSMRSLSDILADCRTAFSGLTESEKASAAEALVGKNAMSGFLALMNASPNDIAKLEGALKECDGVAEKMAGTMQDNLAGQMQILKSQLEELAISFGELLMPAIRTIVSWIQSFVDILNSMDEGTKKVVMTILLLVAAIGPVLIIVGKVISAVGTIMTIMPALSGALAAVKGAFAALNAVMLANPIVLIIAAIAALVAAFIYLWNTNEEFRQFWIDLWNSIVQAATTAWQTISTFLSETWTTICTTASSIWQGLVEFFTTLWENIKTAFNNALTAISTTISNIWTSITTFISTAMNSIWQTITSIWQNVKNTTSEVLNGIKAAIANVFTGLVTSITGFMSNVFSAVQSGFSNVKNFILGLGREAVSWGRDLIMGIVNGIKSAISSLVSAVSSVADTIRSYLHFSVPDVGPLTDYEEWMPDFMEGLANGIEKSRSIVSSAMKDVAADMVLSTESTKIAGYESEHQEQASALSSILSGVDALAHNIANLEGMKGNIVIPVYVGNSKIDELVVEATQRMNYRSGGF